MEEASAPHNSTVPPPNRGLPLGWRLALSTALIISLVMGAVSISQQFLELRYDRDVRRGLLEMSLAPLAARLEAAETLGAMARELKEFHSAHVRKGYPEHDLVLVDGTGRRLLSTRASALPEEEAVDSKAELPLASPLLEGGRGALAILENIQDHADALRRTWLLWAVHFGVTVGIVTLFLAAAIYLQVTRPVNRLVRGVRKMEMGYWGPVEIGGGAWEIRWLAWRFGNMAREVRSSMARLFEAERKARSLMSLCGSAPVPAISRLPAGEDVAASDPTGSLAYRNLEAVCERLEAASPHDPAAVQFARRAWRQDALEANRLGFHQIKARLEDGAFRLMEPDAFADLDGRLAELKASWAEWARQRRNALRQMLEVRAIPCVAVLHRVKHTAGVWSKMHGKGLGIDEVYDLFAFRVVVPTEVDCYAALGVIHHAYQPELSRFKDYIARPKGNGYRSLHTCLKAEDGPVFEVQIRSVAMDRQAERGDAAHWLYKEGGREAPAPRWWDRVRHWAEETLG